MPIFSGSDTKQTVRIGTSAGLVGGVVIWAYEALVWVGLQHMMQLTDIPRNAVGLVFGRAKQLELGLLAYAFGTIIHFFFAMIWGILFALVWPALRRRGIEASLAAVFYAMLAWIVMHVGIALVSNSHPDYTDPNVVTGGFVSHLFFAIPMALVVKGKFGAH